MFHPCMLFGFFRIEGQNTSCYYLLVIVQPRFLLDAVVLQKAFSSWLFFPLTLVSFSIDPLLIHLWLCRVSPCYFVVKEWFSSSFMAQVVSASLLAVAAMDNRIAAAMAELEAFPINLCEDGTSITAWNGRTGGGHGISMSIPKSTISFEGRDGNVGSLRCKWWLFSNCFCDI